MSEDGKRMSLYGKTEVSPEEMAGLLKNVKMRTDRITDRHLAICGNGTALWPGIKQWTKEEVEEKQAAKEDTYYGARTNPSVVSVSSVYDRLFHMSDHYDCKMHRDDRQSSHMIGCSVDREESERPIPLTSSSNYGHRLSTVLEPFSRGHVRVLHVMKGFYHRRGTGLPPIDS